MRKAWKRFCLILLRALGQQEIALTFGVKTVFRGRKNALHQHEWQTIAEVFKRIPDLEDYWRMKLDEIGIALRRTPLDNHLQRVVLQAQAEVIQDCLNLPDTAAAKSQAMLQAKTLKGNTHVHA